MLCWCVQNGWLIGLASSSTRRLVEQILNSLKIKKYFDVIVCGDEVINKKPAPDIYEKVLNLAGLKQNKAIAVEDSETGIKAAKAAGIFCYGYRNKSSGNQDLSDNLKQKVWKANEKLPAYNRVFYTYGMEKFI